jgi:hypothetical protein
MSEEVQNAAMNIPRAMIYSTIVNGIISFGATICILYTMGSVFGLLTSPTGSPIIQIVYQTTQSKRATTALVSLVLTNGVFASFSTTASVSRLIWAFARDNGLPFSSFFVKVQSSTSLPIFSHYLANIQPASGLAKPQNSPPCPTPRNSYHPRFLSHQHRLYRRLHRYHLPLHPRPLHFLRPPHRFPAPQTLL